MKIGEAVRLVHGGQLPLPVLWAIATDPERVQVALILGRPAELPRQLRTIEAAWASLNGQQQRLVHQLAPADFSAGLPDAPAKTPTPPAAAPDRRAGPGRAG